MSETHEVVERHIQNALHIAPGSYDGHLAYDTATMILAAVREALLAPEVVEAACVAAIEYVADAWRVPEEDRAQVAKALTAALNAAGITEASDE